ncbi:hypothetical protein BDZ88DRAFT_414299 [Geranomyces variabilis]|nr:hypothetical protein BDZ88DRAFT_414299 [Geranomyces variabilis]
MGKCKVSQTSLSKSFRQRNYSRRLFSSFGTYVSFFVFSPHSLDVPQKNRIRRNLESLGPTTISKKPDTNAFFAQIMSYTDPKPRNIEKDVKVFPWALLKPALEKILFKMTDGGGNGMRQSESE